MLAHATDDDHSGSAVPSTTQGFASGTCLRNSCKRRAEVLGVAEMRAHAGAEFRFVDEFVRVRAVLEGRLRAEQQRINIRRRTTLQEFTRKRGLLVQQPRVIERA